MYVMLRVASFRKKTYLQNEKALKLISPVLQLDPVLVDNVLRVGGRFNNCPISSRMQPIIIPKSHDIVTLIIMMYLDVQVTAKVMRSISATEQNLVAF